MKRSVAILIIIILIVLVMAPAHADGPVKKLGRGVSNVVTCPFELTKGMGDAQEEGGVFAGLTWGVLQGTVNMVKRAAVGVYEMATFPVPLPDNYDPILEDPEFFLEKRRIE